jgi:hypothetical protein
MPHEPALKAESQIRGGVASQPVPEGDEDHGGVPVPVPGSPGRLGQGIHLARRQVLAGAKFGVASVSLPGSSTVTPRR